VSVLTGIVLYLLIWWTTLFAILPFWTRPVTDPTTPEHFRGAPENPLLLRKLAVNTVVAGALWGVAWWLVTSDWISFRPNP